MKVREKKSPEEEFRSSRFNVHALNEVIGQGDWGADSFYFHELDVFIEAPGSDGVQIGWKDMRQAFKDHDIITDNYNTYFFEPETKESRERGYTL